MSCPYVMDSNLSCCVQIRITAGSTAYDLDWLVAPPSQSGTPTPSITPSVGSSPLPSSSSRSGGGSGAAISSEAVGWIVGTVILVVAGIPMYYLKARCKKQQQQRAVLQKTRSGSAAQGAMGRFELASFSAAPGALPSPMASSNPLTAVGRSV